MIGSGSIRTDHALGSEKCRTGGNRPHLISIPERLSREPIFRMRTRRNAALRSLRLMLVASVVFPLLLFCYASWENYRAAFERADEQIKQALDVSAEQALRVFRSIDVTFDSVEQITRGRTEQTLRLNEAALSERLKQFVKALPDIGSVWILTAQGDAIVSSLFFPVPPSSNSPERSDVKTHWARSSNLSAPAAPRIHPTTR